MALVLNGSGSITGLSAGGLPDGSVTADDIASTLDLSGKTVTLPAGTGGKVLQVVSSQSTGETTVSSASYASTGFSASITPSSASSKILVMFSSGGGGVRNAGSGENDNQFALTNDGGASFVASVRVENYDYGSSGTILRVPFNIIYLDSPATTSAVTYAIYAKVNNSDGAFLGQTTGTTTDWTLMEIAA